MDIREILTEQLNMLKEKGVASSIFELRMLLGHVLQKSPSMLWFNDETLTEEQINKFKDLVKMRARHCPVDKIIGTKGFYKYDFVVNQDVLSPRADSEILVEEALKLICHNNYQKIWSLVSDRDVLLYRFWQRQKTATVSESIFQIRRLILQN